MTKWRIQWLNSLAYIGDWVFVRNFSPQHPHPKWLFSQILLFSLQNSDAPPPPMYDANEDPPTPIPAHNTPQSFEMMDTNATVSPAPNIPLEAAMKQKLKLKKKWLKATSGNCIETNRVPNKLRLQYSEIHMMEAPHTGRTRAAIALAYKRAEQTSAKLFRSTTPKSKHRPRDSWRRWTNTSITTLKRIARNHRLFTKSSCPNSKGQRITSKVSGRRKEQKNWFTWVPHAQPQAPDTHKPLLQAYTHGLYIQTHKHHTFTNLFHTITNLFHTITNPVHKTASGPLLFLLKLPTEEHIPEEISRTNKERPPEGWKATYALHTPFCSPVMGRISRRENRPPRLHTPYIHPSAAQSWLGYQEGKTGLHSFPSHRDTAHGTAHRTAPMMRWIWMTLE